MPRTRAPRRLPTAATRSAGGTARRSTTSTTPPTTAKRSSWSVAASILCPRSSWPSPSPSSAVAPLRRIACGVGDDAVGMSGREATPGRRRAAARGPRGLSAAELPDNMPGAAAASLLTTLLGDPWLPRPVSSGGKGARLRDVKDRENATGRGPFGSARVGNRLTMPARQTSAYRLSAGAAQACTTTAGRPSDPAARRPEAGVVGAASGLGPWRRSSSQRRL